MQPPETIGALAIQVLVRNADAFEEHWGRLVRWIMRNEPAGKGGHEDGGTEATCPT